MMLRDEKPADAAAIEAVTVAAFADHPHSNQTEHIIVARLRTENALILSLVAEERGEVVGHVVVQGGSFLVVAPNLQEKPSTHTTPEGALYRIIVLTRD